MVKLKKQKGFTLVEAIVSMIIIMSCFALSTMTYLNIIKTDNRVNKCQAFLFIEQYAQETIKEKSFVDQDRKFEGLTVRKRMEPYQNDDRLKILRIEVADKNGKPLSTYKQIVIAQ